MPDVKWMLSGESKQIGNYTVYKATMSREVPQQIFQFGRQSDQESKPKMKTVNITACLRLKSQFLLVLQNTGFARTVLEVNTDNTSMLCTKVVMNPKEKMKIKISNKGTVVNAKEYNRIRTDKIKEMREIYRRNRGQGGGRFRSR